jgi:D-alanyl-D-alanine carboxypeptidase
LGLAAVLAVLTVTSDPADARQRRKAKKHHRSHHAQVYSPPFASIVVDANSGAVLQATNPDSLRHPASLTKIMTLYLLFERLEAGRIRLDTPLRISEHAAAQAPSKLDLKPGQSIAVADAIKAIVTKSANDIAVAVAENLGGDEPEFARLMTQKARSLGMARTTYVNASGLPDDDQITTARDQALLGRAIQERFPTYYRYFATAAFVYHGRAMRNHNHLLGQVEGVDGIKTGFTRASGFNLVTSVRRNGRHIVAVVLGGRSAGQRDAHMRDLIGTHIKTASLRRTAPVIAERREPVEARPRQVAFAGPKPTFHVDPTPTATVPVPSNSEPGSTDPIRPLLVRTITYRTVQVHTAALSPMPVMVPVAPPPARATAAEPPRPAPAPVAAATPRPVAAPASESVPVAAPAKPEPAPHPHARGGWLIQIGAFEAEGEARQHLSEAQDRVRTVLAHADPFTERVQKGDKELFRARFAGFDKDQATAACRQLKRNAIDCMAVRN